MLDAMLTKAGRAWRLCATGFSFAAFGVGGLILWLLVFPLLNLGMRASMRRVLVARTIIRFTFRAFVGLMRALGVLRYELVGFDRLERGGLLILANHPTLIDTVFLMAFVERADCIVKASLWNNPFTRGPVRAAGYIDNGQGAQLIDACIASLRTGNNLIVFPEGTRTPPCGSINLQRGAANIAVRGGRMVTPVVITCDPPTLGKGEPWWQIPARRVQFRIEVKDDIGVEAFLDTATSEVLAARRLTTHLQQFFLGETQRHA